MRLPANKERRTEISVSDAAVGDSPVESADAGVQASCGPRGAPIKVNKEAEEEEKERRADERACALLLHS